MHPERNFHLSLTQIIAIGFALIILLGSLLLSLPLACVSGERLPYIDALFTATSATCVTGLIVYDTYTQFTLFGQLVILGLIQIGGLGFMTVSVLFAIVIGKRIGLKERSLIMESISTFQIGGVVRLIRRVLIGTALFELVGAVLLAIRFIPEFGWGRGIYYGVFHSISAFCNAGFDLMGVIEPYCSLTPFRGDFLVNFVVMGLIIIGGIGFVVWDDIAQHRLSFYKYRLHSKIVLTATTILIIVPAILLFILESDHSFQGMNMKEKILAALFQSVSPRTAGFNTVELSELSEGGNLLTVILMLVGASPGSTGGGMKTTTLVVMLLAVRSYLTHANDLGAYGRRLEEGALKRAYCSASIFLGMWLLGSFLILCSQNLPIKDIMFESASAIGTVGLSTGITRSLNAFSRIAIVALMYSGRVGSMSIAMAVAERKHHTPTRLPQEKITIG